MIDAENIAAAWEDEYRRWGVHRDKAFQPGEQWHVWRDKDPDGPISDDSFSIEAKFSNNIDAAIAHRQLRRLACANAVLALLPPEARDGD